jgi:carbamoyl-phosphate synthase large subunit
MFAMLTACGSNSQPGTSSAPAVTEEDKEATDTPDSVQEEEVDAICDGKDVFVPGIMEHVERTGIHSGDSISVYPTFSVSQQVKDTILNYTKQLGLAIGIVGLFNIQFIVDEQDKVFVIEVNPRSSRTVPFLSKATGVPMAKIATMVILGHSLREQGITEMYGKEKSRWFVKSPAFSFAKIRGLDSYLSPEMKSTGEAIGYDDKLHRAMCKALIAGGINIQNYGTVLVTLADEDKEEALPLIRRFYDIGFNIEATIGTATFLKNNGIRTKIRGKISEGCDEILDSIRAGYVSCVINTRAVMSGNHNDDGSVIRRCAVENGVALYTSLDTVKILLDVLEEITIKVSTIDAK